MAKKGKLIGIGVGPGDTELLTLKAAKVLESVPVILFIIHFCIWKVVGIIFIYSYK